MIAATSATIRDVLLEFMASDVGVDGLASFFVGSTTVSFDSPQGMATTGAEGLSLWLYRIDADPTRAPIRGALGLPPPLNLRLHYLLTPVATSASHTEQRIVEKAMELFQSRPVLSGGTLRGELAGTSAEIRIRLEQLSLEDTCRLWEALQTSYRLSVCYEVSVDPKV